MPQLRQRNAAVKYNQDPSESSSSDDDQPLARPKQQQHQNTQNAARKRPTPEPSDSSSSSDDEQDEFVDKPKPKQQQAKRKSPIRRSTRAKTMVIDTTESSDDGGSSPSRSAALPSRATAANRPSRACTLRKPVAPKPAPPAPAAKPARGRAGAPPARKKPDSRPSGGSRSSKDAGSSGSMDADSSGSGSGSSSEDESESEGSEEEEEGSSEEEMEDLAEVGEVERILHTDEGAAGAGKPRFLVKIKGKSYRNVAWVSRKFLWEHRRSLLARFQDAANPTKAVLELSPNAVNGMEPEWTQVERMLASRKERGSMQYLVKWCGLGYSQSTWESAADLKEDQEHVERFKARSKPPAAADWRRKRPSKEEESLIPEFGSGRQLRDYQQESLRWMVGCWMQGKNCILGDEMGLGKTAQSIAVLQYKRQICRIRGPFLVVAPLTTLGHWQREIQTWTDMNVVMYTGGGEDRGVAQEHELYYPHHQPTPRSKDSKEGAGRVRMTKFDVLLTSYETVLREKAVLERIHWDTLVIDEAHRLKGRTSSIRAALMALAIDWKLLLTGTPVQNDMSELYGILNFLDREAYPDLDSFMDTFGGDPPSVDQIRALQEALRPVLLRRMKEDVEQLPEKEEVVVWVDLTAQQRAYYRALYSNQISALLGGTSSKNLPQMRNLAMELRKVCCHPFLCDGLEEDFQLRQGGAPGQAEAEALVRAAGKMVLLDKLLPKLRTEGRQVLIFSQFVRMLDVLEDYMTARSYPCERIDGSTPARLRQAAIDRFSSGDRENAFVFLLSTRAGGQGITLTAADTVIIYDSDWNPQNDLQAMARCHRIGQEREVTVYRLVTANTYEQQLFRTASRKYGLDEAILGFGVGAGGDPEQDSKRIAELLRHGAHLLREDEGAGDAGGDAFGNEDIDQILAGRTEKRQIGSRAGNTFCTAHFSAAQEPQKEAAAAVGEREYWEALLPEAVQQHDAQEAAAKQPMLLGPRKRRQVNYCEADEEEKGRGRARGGSKGRSSGSDESSPATGSGGSSAGDEISEEEEEEEGDELEGKKGRARGKAGPPKWSRQEVKVVLEQVFAKGASRAEEFHSTGALHRREKAEVVAAAEAAVKVAEAVVEFWGVEGGDQLSNSTLMARLDASGEMSRLASLLAAIKAKVPEDTPESLLQELTATASLKKLTRSGKAQLQKMRAMEHLNRLAAANNGTPPSAPEVGMYNCPTLYRLSWERRHDDALLRAVFAEGLPACENGSSRVTQMTALLQSPSQPFITLGLGGTPRGLMAVKADTSLVRLHIAEEVAALPAHLQDGSEGRSARHEELLQRLDHLLREERRVKQWNKVVVEMGRRAEDLVVHLRLQGARPSSPGHASCSPPDAKDRKEEPAAKDACGSSRGSESGSHDEGGSDGDNDKRDPPREPPPSSRPSGSTQQQAGRLASAQQQPKQRQQSSKPQAARLSATQHPAQGPPPATAAAGTKRPASPAAAPATEQRPAKRPSPTPKPPKARPSPPDTAPPAKHPASPPANPPSARLSPSDLAPPSSARRLARAVPLADRTNASSPPSSASKPRPSSQPLALPGAPKAAPSSSGAAKDSTPTAGGESASASKPATKGSSPKVGGKSSGGGKENALKAVGGVAKGGSIKGPSRLGLKKTSPPSGGRYRQTVLQFTKLAAGAPAASAAAAPAARLGIAQTAPETVDLVGDE